MYLFGNTEQDSIFTIYSIFHFLFGFVWYWIFFIIEKRRSRRDSEGNREIKTRDLIISYFLMSHIHLLFEIVENTKEGIRFFGMLGWREYGGDRILNAIADHLCSILGFWIGYFVFGV